MTQRSDFPSGAPRGVWKSVTDRAVYDRALDDAERDPGSQFNFILTMTSHLPFDRPEDLPPAIEERVTGALSRSSIRVGHDDAARLLTFAYADWALERFLARLEASPLAAQSLVVISADHSTADELIWPSGPSVRALSAIPLLVYVPRAFLSASADPGAASRQIAALNALAQGAPVSSNDVPTMLLALLSSSAPIAGHAPSWRWHSMGGMATSPHYTLPGRPASRLWGIDAQSRIFSVDAPTLSPTALAEPYPPFSDFAQIERLGDVSASVAAFLGSYLRGYASRCPGAEHVRASNVSSAP
jgi:hypothetical protein